MISLLLMKINVLDVGSVHIIVQMKRLSWVNDFILDLAAARLAPVPLEELRYGASA